jgi:hypothetical protein
MKHQKKMSRRTLGVNLVPSYFLFCCFRSAGKKCHSQTMTMCFFFKKDFTERAHPAPGPSGLNLSKFGGSSGGRRGVVGGSSGGRRGVVGGSSGGCRGVVGGALLIVLSEMLTEDPLMISRQPPGF